MNILSSKEFQEIDFSATVLSEQLYPVIQPIWDLFSGQIYGFEVLMRNKCEHWGTEELFEQATKAGSLWNLEYICREKILKLLSGFDDHLKNKFFFINIDHSVMSDNLFKIGFSRSLLSRYGLSYRNIIIEVSEKASLFDYKHFEKIIKAYKQEGLQVAIDDFGLGHCSIKTLTENTPHYIKIDHKMIKGLEQSSEKQGFLQSLLSLTRNQEIQIIAEGIENWDELKVLFSKGIRYIQGHLIGYPGITPPYINSENIHQLKNLVSSYHNKQFSIDLSILSSISLPANFQLKELTCSQLDDFFRHHHNQDHILLLDGRKAYGLITKQHFYAVLNGPYGYSFYEKKYIDEIATTQFLLVEENKDLRYVSKLALSRDHYTLYDPVIVTNSQGQVAGTITIHQLIDKAFDIEIKMAIDANPLTELPGNKIIGQWLETLLQQKDYSVIYADLDSFKEYNDTYGFASGDRMIYLVSQILKKYSEQWEQAARLGHIGGDDFILLIDGIVPEQLPEIICLEFDKKKKELFNSFDWDQGYYFTSSRQGEKIQANLVTLSLSIITSRNFLQVPHPRQLSQNVSLLKKKVKTMNMRTRKSGYIYDQRNNE